MPTVVYQVQPAKKQYDGNSGVSGTAYVSQNQSGGYSGVSARYNLGYTPSVNLHEPGPVWWRQNSVSYAIHKPSLDISPASWDLGPRHYFFGGSSALNVSDKLLALQRR